MSGRWISRSAILSFRRLQLHVDVLLLREGEHLLETFLTPEARLLEAAKRRAQEVLAHFVDLHEAGFHRHGGAGVAETAHLAAGGEVP